MNKYKIFLIAMLFLFISCKKETAEEQKIPPADSEFITCNCSEAQPDKPVPDEYIKGTINGVDICADVKGNFTESFDNMIRYGKIKRSTGDTYYDNVHMIRFTKDGKFMLAIFMENSHLFTKQFPYQLPRSNPEYCEIGELQVQNQQRITPNMCSFCPENNWHYLGSFFQDYLKLTADKFENGLFEGRFEGSIRTGSGRYATVKDGKFRIRLAMIERDIIIP